MGGFNQSASPNKSMTHSIGSGTITLVIVLIIVFVVYRHLSIRLVNTSQTHLVRTYFFFFYKCNKRGNCQEAFNTGGFLCAVLDLSGILWSLLIPEYSGIKRRGTLFPGAEESRHFLC